MYKSKAPISDLEVDYVQGMWCIKTEWLQSIVEALPQELSEGVQFVINVFISAILWIKYGVRTLQPALMSASLNSVKEFIGVIKFPFNILSNVFCRWCLKIQLIVWSITAGTPDHLRIIFC